MKTKEVLMAINGKKLPFALVLTIIGAGVGYGELKNSVKHNSKELKNFKPTIEQVARIDERVKGLKEDFTDFRDEQRTYNGKIDGKIDKVLEALSK